MQISAHEAPPMVRKDTRNPEESSHSEDNHDKTLSPEQLYITYMDAAYEAPDKETYFKMMRKAQECLRKRQATFSDRVDHTKAV